MHKRIEAASYVDARSSSPGLGRRSCAALALILAALAVSLLMPAAGSAAAPGSISGKVTSSAGHAAIEGIEVCALTVSTHNSQGCAPTGADGTYTISNLTAGSYDVEFYGYGDLNYLTQYYNGKATLNSADPVSVSSGATTPNIDAEMHPGGQIKGKVVEAAGKAPIEGIEVCAQQIDGTQIFRCDTSGAGGEYAIPRLPTGSYKVSFSGYGDLNYLTQYYNGKQSFEAADPVSVTAGSSSSGIDAEMHAGGEIEGSVVDAGSKAPVASVEVCAYRGSDESSSRCAYTESDGGYVLTGLATGSYTVKFKPDYNDHVHVKQFYDDAGTREAATPVSVTAGAATPDIDAEMHEGGKVSGAVTKAAGGTAIEGITVCALPTHYEYGDYGSNCGLTDAAGKYTISGLGEAGYKIQFSGGINYLSQFYDNATESEATAVSVSLGTTTPNINAKLQVAGQIKGKIVDAVSKAPLNSVEVCAFKPESNYPQGTCAYVNNGEYTIGGLPTGAYKVRFSAGYGEIAPGEYGQLNYATQFYNGKATEAEAEPVAVTAGSATANIDAEMHVGGKIAGTVVSASGKAGIQGAEVCASPVSRRASPGGCVQTNAAGEYTIPRLVTGSYRVRFRAGYEHPEYLVQFYSGKEKRGESDPVAVTAGATTPNIDAELQEGGRVSGKVIDATSKVPLKEIGVCVRASCATTNAAGEYTVQGLPSGYYKVRFTPGYLTNRNYISQYYDGQSTFEAANEIAVTAGATTPNIDAEMHQGGKVKGTVIDATTKAPVQNVEVCAVRGSGEEYEYTGCARTDASGAYAIEGLSGGSYKVGFFTYGNEGGGPSNLNYLTQYYSGAASLESAAAVAVTPGSTATGIDAELHEGGKISGTVTAAPSAAPLHYAEACAVKLGGSEEEEYGECARTDAAGHYTIEGLGSGSYTVRFSSFVPGMEAQNNYLTRYYDEKGPGEAADPVSVTVGSTTAGIDAELQVGGQIKGKVVAASNGVPLREVSVCALAVSAGEEEFGSCAQTNGSGEYTISGLASGAYKVKFSALNYEYEEGIPFAEGEITPEEEFTTQFYNGKPTLAQAAPVSVTVGSAVGGINASMVEASAAASKPVNTGAPVLSGAPVPGEALSCSPGIWSGNPTGYAYRWLRDGSEISAAGGTAYTVQSADQGHAISCRVTASNGKGSTSATSNAVEVAAAGGGGTQYGLVVSLAGTGAGTVTSAPGGISCSPGCTHDYAAGTSVVLTPAPASGSSFAGWSGACTGTGTCHVTLNAATAVTATFNADAGGGGGTPGGGSGGGGGTPGGGGGGAAAGAGPSSSSPTAPAPAPAKPKTLKCKKGFKKTAVKGKAKCVKLKHHRARKRPST